MFVILFLTEAVNGFVVKHLKMSYYRRAFSGFLTPRLLLCKPGSKKYSETKTIDVKNNEGNHSRIPSDTVAPEIVTPQNFYSPPRQVWVENFDTVKEEKKGIINLHPKIFAAMPRLDVIAGNIRWQLLYRKVDRTNAKTRAECPGSNRKPYPQKGLGKARQGSVRAPHFIRGGACHGPRDPTTHFYMLSVNARVTGLTSALSVKFAQGDIRVIENLDMPTDSPDFILDLIDERAWGSSVLFVDREDIMPRNVVAATRDIGHVNLMPVYGLNVYSIIKHECLVLTLNAVKEIENRLLAVLQSPRNMDRNVYENFPFK